MGGEFKGFHPTHTPGHTCPHLAASSPLWNELLGIKEQGGLTGGPQDSGLGLGGPWEDWGGPGGGLGGLDHSGADGSRVGTSSL